ncbi:hypothetical protein HYV49_01790 [Candidatus Pacearchaeota archaeon]|nr:hypothetical protein [Candidatus Pacearchaeota archaeon]
MELEGVLLSGFNELEEIDKNAVNRVLGEYMKKMKRHHDFKQLHIHIKKNIKGKVELFEIKANLQARKVLSSSVEGYNPYKTLAEVLENLMKELEHEHTRNIRASPREL